MSRASEWREIKRRDNEPYLLFQDEEPIRASQHWRKLYDRSRARIFGDTVIAFAILATGLGFWALVISGFTHWIRS